ncbi:hypothetical protein DAPPUDRAFT_326296 [Daphnia pulex]|uniref:CCHC-type domain-containing protein n=1 Tax=Daphnia pulex TaxID=6669 RepID=E9H7B7_DAPPU|nr:hypothetical protein DAPPUDRAFT_326296 [Daphnia pulex]|eukprot:EFX72394.1 hypothetical protein DAPPUDRAFT_326296 [Daphnia pulex]
MGDTALLTRLSLANTKLNPLIRGLVKDDQKIKPMPNEAHRVWWFVQFGKQQNLSRRPSPYPQRGRGGNTQCTRNEPGLLKNKRPRDFGRCSHCNSFGHEVQNCNFKNTEAVHCGYCDKYGHEEK